jgi:hypothetical protein
MTALGKSESGTVPGSDLPISANRESELVTATNVDLAVASRSPDKDPVVRLRLRVVTRNNLDDGARS